MSIPPRRPVLGDHVAVKRKLVPPFVHKAGSTLFQYSWTRQLVPEAIWIVLLIDRYGFEPACRLCLALVQAVLEVSKDDSNPPFLSLSTFATLTAAQQTEVLHGLAPATLDALQVGLSPLAAIVPDHPLSFLGAKDGPEESVEARFPNVLNECYDRNSRLAVLSMAAAERLAIEQGKLHVAEHLIDDLIARFEVIGDYPDTAAPMLFMTPAPDSHVFESNSKWVRVFWEGVAGFGPCIFPDTFGGEAPGDDDPHIEFIVAFRNAVRADLRARLERWPLDLNEAESYEVIAALLSRQAQLVIEFAAAPPIWTPHSAPIFLRAIADAFISLAWILKDPGSRARLFVEDGLGTIKLQIAHQEQALHNAQDPDEQMQLRQMIELWRSWLESQRLDTFIEVNLGSWSGLNTRKMAQEAGFIDFYNHVYQPFSGVAHPNWAHVSMFNTASCGNPAHRHHRVPALIDFEPDPHWLYLAAKYLSKTFGHFDQVQGLDDLPHAAFEFVAEVLVKEPLDN
jgi:Family of unknown function (DUF5677)